MFVKEVSKLTAYEFRVAQAIFDKANAEMAELLSVGRRTIINYRLGRTRIPPLAAEKIQNELAELKEKGDAT